MEEGAGVGGRYVGRDEGQGGAQGEQGGQGWGRAGRGGYRWPSLSPPTGHASLETRCDQCSYDIFTSLNN